MDIHYIIWDKITADTKCKKQCQGQCGICQTDTLCRSDARSNNFTNHEEVTSLLVCDKCLKLLASDYRKRSFYITQEQARTVSQWEIYDILNNMEYPCILSFTDSNKKHRLFRSLVSTSPRDVVIVLDDRYLRFNLEKEVSLLHYLSDFYNAHKVSKKDMAKWVFPINTMKKIWLENVVDYMEVLKPYIGTDILDYFIKFINKTDG